MKRSDYQRLINNCQNNDLGELTLSQVVKRAVSPDHIANLALLGDEFTLNRFLASRKGYELVLPEQLQPSYDVAGDFVDVGRYLSGEPECMFNYDGQPDQAKLIDVTIRLGRPSKTPDFKVFKYYSNVLQAIDLLESKGLRCRMTAAFDGFHRDERLRITFNTPIKEHYEPVNMAVFAGVILNNDFFSSAICDLIDLHYMRRMTSRIFCSDMVDIEVTQTEQAITFPSMYFNNYSSAGAYPFSDYMKVIGLGYLLPEQ